MSLTKRPPITFYPTSNVLAYLLDLPPRSRSSEINQLLWDAISTKLKLKRGPDSTTNPSLDESANTNVLPNEMLRLVKALEARVAQVEEDRKEDKIVLDEVEQKTATMPQSGEALWDKFANDDMEAFMESMEKMRNDGMIEFLEELKEQWDANPEQ
jgi:hypothetical protein